MSGNFESLNFLIANGRILCIQCNAMSKRTRQQCRAPAIKGKKKCRFHGGLSSGPNTQQGRQKCAEARTTHGRDTKKMRSIRHQDILLIAKLESLGFQSGILVGTRSRGPKPITNKSLKK